MSHPETISCEGRRQAVGYPEQAISAHDDGAWALRVECGCAMGARFATLTAVAALLLVYSGHLESSGSVWRDGVMVSAAVVISALSGKVVGIASARIRLWLLLRAVADSRVSQNS